MYRKIIKPLLDFVFSGILFLFLIPVFILITILLSISYHGNPFFIQLRPGKNQKIFKILKFKTMNESKDTNGNLLPDEQRLTGIGSWIRKLSLDELPQLINVIKGDMSFIGPRPLLTRYLPLYNSFQNRRHEVKPGITGWAQVNGRNSITWNEKFELDVWYVDHISLITDLKILYLTLLKVIKREGINTNSGGSMEEFKP